MANAADELFEVIRERFKDHFLAAFTVAFCADNWRSLYRLIRFDRPVEQVISSMDAFDLCTPLAYAACFAVLYPVIKAVQGVFGDLVAVGQHNVSKWLHLRKLVTVAELGAHEEYRQLGIQVADLRDQVSTAWRIGDPNRPTARLVFVYRAEEPIEVPCFVYNRGNYNAGHFTKLPGLGNPELILFAFEKIGANYVVAAQVGASIPWPAKYEKVRAIALDGTKTVPSAEHDPEAIANALASHRYLAIARRGVNGDDKWGALEIASTQPAVTRPR